MKSTILFGLLFILSAAIASGQTKNQKDSNGRKQGYWEAVDRNGNLVYKGYFKDDKPVGEMTRYYPGGKAVRVIMQYEEGGEKARARFFGQNGELAATGNYVRMLRDSIWVYYSYQSKTISNKTTYRAGKKDGPAQSFYPDGNPAEEVEWQNDLKDGTWKQYFENGQLKLSAIYVKNQLEGKFTTFYPDGKKETEGNYKNDFPDGKWVYYEESGKVLSTIEYVNGKIENFDELKASEQEFFKKVEEQKGKIKEPTLEDVMRESLK